MGSRIDHSASLRLLECGIYLNHAPELKRSQMDSIEYDTEYDEKEMMNDGGSGD